MAKKTVKKKVNKKAGRKVVKKTPSRKTVSKKKTVKKKSRAAKSRVSRPKRAKSTSRAGKPPAPEFPSSIGFVTQHVDFLTYKVEQLRKFYGDLLGFKTEQGESDLNYLFVHTSPTSSIGFMPPHPQMTSEQPPPRESTLYFVVEDVDRVFSDLMAKGVAFMGPPQEMPWGHRVIMTHDPEGRTLMMGSAYKKE